MSSVLYKIKRLFSKGGLYYSFYYMLRKTRISNMFSDRMFTMIEYRANTGKSLNLKNPTLYNEKLQWLKLNDHQEIYTKLVDKFRVKEYVSQLLGEKYVIPTLAVYATPDDIDLEQLPNQFVLKTNHSGGNTGVVICKNKEEFDLESAKKLLAKSLATDVYKISREWPYKNVKRCIIAEKYMEDTQTGELRDYKFFCFDGIPKALFVASGRQKQQEVCFDFFDIDYTHINLKSPHPLAAITPEKPSTFDEMKEMVHKLSQGFPHVRIDLYEINGRPYFGEFTLYHWEGLMPFDPEDWNYTFGSWINLPQNNK